jgi:hypothetical protein
MKPSARLIAALAATLAAASLISGCAIFDPAVPVGYTGPTAKVLDWGGDIREMKAELYVLKAIDGRAIESTITASHRASANQGLRLTVAPVERDVPARPMKVTLRATHITAAPIHELMSRAAKTFFEVEGVVDFHPRPGATYVVMGKLQAQGSQVWIEEEGTSIRATAVVTAP